jgi:exopolyphosphatase/guanosine-5'-triphosphate,3'-diphosphate pyrophosphatase
VTRVAAVDLGTNSTRLLVADVENGDILEVERYSTVTGLGRGVDGAGELQPAAVGRVRDCLSGYRETIERLGAERTLAFATSAVRDAANGDAFLTELTRDFGFESRLLAGREEAALMFRGVASGATIDEGTLLVDIGGGSTELVLGGSSGVRFSTSLQAGSVRMTERHLHSDPPIEAELEACAGDVRDLLPTLEASRAIGVAATVKTAVALFLGLSTYDRARIHGRRITTAGLDDVYERLASLSVAGRRGVPALEPERAPVIVGGLVVLREVLGAYSLDGIEASDRDILHGAVLVAAES